MRFFISSLLCPFCCNVAAEFILIVRQKDRNKQPEREIPDEQKKVKEPQHHNKKTKQKEEKKKEKRRQNRRNKEKKRKTRRKKEKNQISS